MTTTLLAVDDSKTMRKVLEITFAGEPQFKVVLAESAEDALAKLDATQPQLALVDVTLHGQSGYDLCRQIKERAPGTAVLLLPSKQQPYDPARGGAAGVDDFIDKPFDTQQLIDKVSQICQTAPTLQPVGVQAQRSAPPPPVSTRADVRAPSRAPERERLASQAPQKPKVASMAPQVTASSVVSAAVSPKLAQDLQGLGLSSEQVEAVMVLSREVVERVVWEVVPVLAEALIKEEIQRLTAE